MKKIYVILMTALGSAAAPALPFVIQNCSATDSQGSIEENWLREEELLEEELLEGELRESARDDRRISLREGDLREQE